MYTATFIFAKRQFDDEFHRLDAAIAQAARQTAGYLGEESWENTSTGLVSNVYYWASLEALQNLMDHPIHRLAKAAQANWLDSYRVEIGQVLRRYGDDKVLAPSLPTPMSAEPTAVAAASDAAVTIRPARTADLPAIAALFDQYRQFYEQAPDAPTALAFLSARQQRGESVLLLATDAGGQALGFCQLYPSFCSVLAAPIYLLYDLYVTPASRRLGIGRALLQAAEARARTDGKRRMDLTTARDNHRAQALYTSLGWQLDTVFLAYTRDITPG